MKTIFDFAAKRAELSPDRIAFIEHEGGSETTFAAFDARAQRCAAALARLGLSGGERVAILCYNTTTFFEILFGCGKAGTVLVPLNWRQTPAELAPILSDCGAGVLIHDAATAALAASLTERSDVRLISFPEYEALIAQATHPDGAEFRRDTAWPTDRVWYLLYTSGTTGRPKAVIQTVGMALANAINVQLATGLSGEDRMANFLPLFHTAGINLHTLPLFISGGFSTILPRFEVDPLLDLIAAGRVTVLFGVPAIYQAICLSPRFAKVDLTVVRQ